MELYSENMEKTLVIVRHGNTFAPGQTPTRAGARTDIPLVEELRSRNAARYLLTKGIVPDRVFAAPLKRTMQTAKLIINEMKLDTLVIPNNNFMEIDYGEDENKTEEQVRRRLGLEYVKNNNLSGDTAENEIIGYGKAIIDLWNTKTIVPVGWNVDVESIIFSWKNFANSINDNETTLICSSNGIIRFAPCILDEPDAKDFGDKHDLKVATGSVSIFKTVKNIWKCVEWNVKYESIC
ncbi:MAG: histidine phosphatase family protein [Prevotellaceae bacterium]|jgi:probable phosphoglycerate mutase|nr:histidine phosphatase family protein [Prevotellaceae bacterium]